MEKICTTCDISKDAEKDFYLLLKSSDKRRAECKDCGSRRGKTPESKATRKRCSQSWKDRNPERYKQAAKQWIKNNPDKVLGKSLWAIFRIRLNDYRQMVVLQGGVCAICRKPPKEGQRLCVDHDHACCPRERCCGECIRGLLCMKCNMLLGHAEDNTERLDSAKEYLRLYARTSESIPGIQGQAGSVLEPLPAPSSAAV